MPEQPEQPETPQLLSPPEAAAYSAIRVWLTTHEATGIATPEAARTIAAAVLAAEQHPARLFMAPVGRGTLAHRLTTWWGTRPLVMRWRTRHWQDVGYTTEPEPQGLVHLDVSPPTPSSHRNRPTDYDG